METKYSYIGEMGELAVLGELLKRNFESYKAIKTNQKGYDLTVINNNKAIVRIQVKTTDLGNYSTNNSISITNNHYDILVIAVICKGLFSFYVLSQAEVKNISNLDKKTKRGNDDRPKLYISQLIDKKKCIKNGFAVFMDKWETINALHPKS